MCAMTLLSDCSSIQQTSLNWQTLSKIATQHPYPKTRFVYPPEHAQFPNFFGRSPERKDPQHRVNLQTQRSRGRGVKQLPVLGVRRTRAQNDKNEKLPLSINNLAASDGGLNQTEKRQSRLFQFRLTLIKIGLGLSSRGDNRLGGRRSESFKRWNVYGANQPDGVVEILMREQCN